jgi:feruloyl esterase
MSFKNTGISIVFCFISVAPFATARADTCESLMEIALPYTTITTAQSIPAGTFTPPVGNPIGGVPAFCRVVGVIKPTADSAIGFEVWLPTIDWNGKLEQFGNGGFAGVIPYVGTSSGTLGLSDGLRRGYASAATDDGHVSSSVMDASWALGHPQKVVDFSYRAVHETADKAKAIIDAFYGVHATRSYFFGCSSGGREALMAAQRYPEDYDGIVAGAPAIGITHLMAAFAWNQQSMLADLASYIPFAKLPAIQKASLDTCDAADGIVDGIINDPTKCHFDPSVLLCNGPETNGCLTAPQLAALQRIYAGPRAGERQIFPGLASGSEGFNLGKGSWSGWVTGTKPGASFEAVYANQFFANMVFEDPAWNLLSLNFTSDIAFADEKLGSLMNGTDPDLSAFAARGAKLIMHQGWVDPAISSYNSVNYYKSVIAAQRPGKGRGEGEDTVALRRTQGFFCSWSRASSTAAMATVPTASTCSHRS